MIGIGIAAVLGELGGGALADALAPRIFGAGSSSISGVEAARDAGMAYLESMPLGGRFAAWGRVELDDGTEETISFASDKREDIDFWYASIESTPDTRLRWAGWRDSVMGTMGASRAGTPSIVVGSGKFEIPEASRTAFKVFQFASKAFVGAAAFAVGSELGVWK